MIRVCLCGHMPYLHLYGEECNEIEEFVPTELEKKEMERCLHEDQFDGVCGECGKVVDEKTAERYSKKG